MTKNELLEVQNFIKEMRQSDEDIEVMNSIYVWIKQKYEEQGEEVHATTAKIAQCVCLMLTEPL